MSDQLSIAKVCVQDILAVHGPGVTALVPTHYATPPIQGDWGAKLG